MSELNLQAETIEKIEKLIPRYPEKRSGTLPLLHLIQEDQGYISKDAIEWIAEKLELEPINVYEVVTFYPMFRQEPIGKRHVRVCRTLSCALNGGYEVCKTLQKELNCELNGNSPDGNFHIEFVECIASCGTAPVVHIDDDMHENITPDKAVALANQLKKEQGIT